MCNMEDYCCIILDSKFNPISQSYGVHVSLILFTVTMR